MTSSGSNKTDVEEVLVGMRKEGTNDNGDVNISWEQGNK
jgi:hypothetical protein